MSSSKIFKNDDAFHPTNLVQEEIPRMFAEESEMPEPEVIQECESSGMEHPAEELANNAEKIAAATEPPGMEAPPAAASAEEKPAPPPVDIDAIREEAYNQGAADANQQFQAGFSTALQALEQICQKLDALRTSILIQCREEIINTTISLTRNIVGQEISTGRDLIAHTVETAIDQAIESEEFTIRLHPDDLRIVEEMQPDILKRMSGLNHIFLKADDSIERGGCILNSKTCLVDATIGAQLEKARRFLLEQVPPLEQTMDTGENDQ